MLEHLAQKDFDLSAFTPALEHLDGAKSLLSALTKEKELPKEVKEKINKTLDNCLAILLQASHEMRSPRTQIDLENVKHAIDCIEKLHKVYQ